jgi:hypothetical protein
MRYGHVVFMLLLMGLGHPLYAQDSQDAVNGQILEALNKVRSGAELAPLQSEIGLDQMALILLDGIAPDCSFSDASDSKAAQSVAWAGDYQIVRDCGVNRTLAQAITAFSTQQSSVTGQALILERQWNAIGLASDEQTTSAGSIQYRYVMVLGVAGSAAALAAPQDFPLDASLTYQEITLSYPTSWTVDQSDGLILLSNPADLSAAQDNNPSTKAGGPFISLDTLARASLDLPADAGLQEADKLVQATLGLTAVTSTDEAVMGYHARTLLATDANADTGLVTFWLTAESLHILVYSAPDPTSVQAFQPAWSGFLARLQPAQSQPLESTVTSRFMQTTFAYPSGWAVFDGADRFGLFQQQSDYDLYVIGQEGFYSAVVVTVLYQATSQILQAGLLTSEDNLDELLALNINFVGLQSPVVEQGYVFGRPAYWVKTPLSSGFFGLGVMGFVDDHVYFILATAPDQAQLDAFEVTFRWMVHTLQR